MIILLSFLCVYVKILVKIYCVLVNVTQDETASLIKDMTKQMADLLQANKELRAENEYLRKIY